MYRFLIILFLGVNNLAANAQLFNIKHDRAVFERMLYAPGEANYYDTVPHMVLDTCILHAYMEIRDIMEHKVPYNLKRMQFWIEWAYKGSQ